MVQEVCSIQYSDKEEENRFYHGEVCVCNNAEYSRQSFSKFIPVLISKPTKKPTDTIHTGNNFTWCQNTIHAIFKNCFQESHRPCALFHGLL